MNATNRFMFDMICLSAKLLQLYFKETQINVCFLLLSADKDMPNGEFLSCSNDPSDVIKSQSVS